MFLPIAKTDEEQQIVWGWASLSVSEDGRLLVDRQGDVILPHELEKAAYSFVLKSRTGGDMHQTMGVATLVESFVVTPEKLAKMGLPADALPLAWWVGFKVHNDDVWAKVKKGEYTGFSIGGKSFSTKAKVKREHLFKHGGPGPHEGTGTPQSAHGRGGGTAVEESLADSLRRVGETQLSNAGERIKEKSKGLGSKKRPKKVAEDDIKGDPRKNVDGYLDETERINQVIDFYLKAGMDTESLFDKRTDGTWDATRVQQHEQIMSDLFADAIGRGAKADHQLLVAAGLGGAGKSTTIKSDAKGARKMGVDLDEYIVVNADDIKEELVKRKLVPDYPGLQPMETAALIHEESSHIAKQMLYKASQSGMNVVFDGTFGSSGAVRKARQFINDSGPKYKVTAMFVRSSVDQSVERAAARHLRGKRQSEMGGRYVPFSFIEGQRTDTGRLSKNEDIFEGFKGEADQWFVWENGKLVDSGGRVSKVMKAKPKKNKPKALSQEEIEAWAQRIRKVKRKPKTAKMTAEWYWDAEVAETYDDATEELEKARARDEIDLDSYLAVLQKAQATQKGDPGPSDVHQAVDSAKKRKRKERLLARIRAAAEEEEDE